VLEFMGRERIRAGSEITRVVKAQDGFHLSVSGREEFFDEVVLTTPAYETAELLRDMDEELSIHLCALDWSSTAIIFAFRKEEIRCGCPGSASRAKNREPQDQRDELEFCQVVLSCTGRFLLIRSFVGGGHHEELVFEGMMRSSRSSCTS
jgi:hypothetical protein